MSFTDTSTANFLVGDGSNLIFPFTFALQQSADMRVYVNQVLISSGLYTVTINASGVGGNVTFNGGQAPANLAQTVLTRVVALTQATQLPREGSVPAKTLEKAYDKLTQLVQDLDARLDRTFGLSLFTTYSGSYEMQDPAASTVPQMNAGRTAVQWVSPSTLALSLNTSNTRLTKLVGWRASYDHTLSASDVLTPLIVTDANATATINVKANSGTTDSLQLVAYQDGSGNVLLQDGEEILIRAYTGHTITVVPNIAAGANQLTIILQEGNSLALSGNKVIRLQRKGTELHEISKAGFNTNDSYFLRLGGTNQLTSPRPLLNIPAAPTVTVVGTTGATTRSYAVTDGDPWGTETAVSANGSVANANGTLNGSNYCRIQFPTVLGRIYKVYRTVASGTPSTTGLIATVAGTGGTATVDDTNLAASTAAPAAHTWKGRYEHVGNYSLDANVTGTEVDIYIIGDFNGGGNTYTYTGVTPFPGVAQNIETRMGYTGAGLSPGIHGGYVDTAGSFGPSGAGNGGAGGRGASNTASGGIPGGAAIPIEIFSAGSSGATSGTFTTKGGNAGDAGGKLYIECFGSLTWMTVNCNGGAGTAGSAANDPGGSGGSGGCIVGLAKTANIVPASCTLSANGGGGGNGGTGGAARYGGGGGGAGKVVLTCEDQDPQISGSTSVTGGSAGTSTSAATTAQAGSSGATKIIRQKLMNYSRAA